MRTDEEILARIKHLDASVDDLFGTTRSQLVVRLPLDKARPYLVDDATPDRWDQQERDDATVLDEMRDYMDFAWEKANNCRGLSSCRSLNHMAAWLWLLGEEEAADALAGYEYYGKPQLRAICEHYGMDWQKRDNGIWTNNEDEDGSPPGPPAELPWTQETASHDG